LFWLVSQHPAGKGHIFPFLQLFHPSHLEISRSYDSPASAHCPAGQEVRRLSQEVEKAFVLVGFAESRAKNAHFSLFHRSHLQISRGYDSPKPLLHIWLVRKHSDAV
jgi:hypothetical protein